MREIKFRAWYKGEKYPFDEQDLEDYEKPRMIYDIQNAYDGSGIKDKYNGFGYVSCFNEFLGEDDFVVMQFTGLKDKNGTEIYEGDIVKVTSDFDDVTIGKVEWGLSSNNYGTYPAFCIYEFESEMNSFAAIYDLGVYEIEIIGNIYEHPHLLGESK